MGTLKTEKHFIVELNFRKKSDNTLKTIYISERSFESGYLWTGSPEIFGLIDQINGFGQSMGEVISINESGSISVKATIGTLAYNMRLYDLLNDYILVNQPIQGFSFQKPRDTIGDIADKVSEFSGKVANYKINISSEIFTIEVNSNDFSTEIVNSKFDDLENAELTSSIFRFPIESADILLGNKNSFAPIIFGDPKQVIATPLIQYLSLNADNKLFASSVLYGISSKLGEFTYSLVDGNSYVRDYFNNIISLDTPVGGSVNSLEQGTDVSPTEFDCYRAGAVAKYYFPITTTGVSAIFHGIQLTCKGSSLAFDTTGQLKIRLLKRQTDITVFPSFIEIPNSRVEINKFLYDTEIGLSAQYRINLFFSKPMYIRPTDVFYLEVEESGFAGAKELIFIGRQGGSSVKPIFYSVKNSSNDNYIDSGFDIPSLGGTGTFNSRLLICSLVANDLNNFISVEAYNSKPSSGDTVSDLKLYIESERFLIDSFIYETEGLGDDTSGTITGIPSQLITSSYHILKALYYLQNGLSLTGWDELRFPDAEGKSLKLGGVEYKSRTYRQLMLDIAEAGSSAIIKNRDGSVSTWAYTCEQDVKAIITERNCVLESIETMGVESIVNRFSLAYNKTEVPYNASASDTKSFNDNLIKVSSESQAIYGVLEPDATFLENSWIDTFDSADRYTQYKIDQMEFERFRFNIRVPFWFDNYRELELWDLVFLSHIGLPSSGGALPPHKTKNLGEGVDWAIGDVLRHARSYLCRIVKRKPVYSKGREPEIIFTLRTLGKNEQF